MKKRFGQNFLIDKNIAELEVKYANISDNDVVLEIGPGDGILTKLLAKKAKKVVAIEIDRELINNLKNSLPYNVDLIAGDALKIDYNILPKFNKIVSNLPFQISSPITFKFLDFNFDLAVLIYQKEFAERMIASAGTKNYSRLSVGIYYKTKCELLKNISKNCFRPQPKVDSCMIRLIPRETPPFNLKDEKLFYNLTKNLFSHRRKKIKNILNYFYDIDLKDLPYLEDRIEKLTPEQIGHLSNMIHVLI